ncbi:MAG: helix-turn-helix transcriptional regulator [Roseburia sp.]|nr:helix-turn-helix transcriptional regulator [Roseburia sp.]
MYNIFFKKHNKFDDTNAQKNIAVEEMLAKTIIENRNQAGLTQNELSKLTGIPQANISKIENGMGNPSLKLLKRIAKSLNKKLIIRME